MEVLLMLLGLGGVAALMGMFEAEGESEFEAEGESEEEPDIEIEGTHAAFENFAVLNDTVFLADGWRDEEIIVDSQGVEAGVDRVGVYLESNPGEQSDIQFELNDDENLEIQGLPWTPSIVLEGVSSAPEGLMEVHFGYVGSDGVVEAEDIDASFESVEVLTGNESDEHLTVEAGGLDLAAVLGEGGEDTISYSNDAILRAYGGDGNDHIDTSEASSSYEGQAILDHDSTVTIFRILNDGGSFEPVLIDGIYGQAGDDQILLGERMAVVDGGEGDDVITGTADAALLVSGGAGNDLIDMRTTGDTSDIVAFGGDGTDTFLGGAGDDVFIDYGDDGDGIEHFDGGGGDDTIWGNTGSALIEGGTGDDFISGYDVSEDYAYFATTPFSSWIDNAPDTLDGGTGDDTLVGSTGDVMAGGDGNDTFEIYSALGAAEDGEAAVITDFEPGEEQLTVTIHFDDIGASSDYWVDDEDWDAGFNPDLVEVDGDTHVMFEGQTLVVLEGTTGVSADSISGEVFLPYHRW
ncbi:calcium-binding protein [Thalassovita sp.]|uniref:calcium-binding protein n=1 Tax=Thalassovita sp. TaxID=1979401 RepID=UPI002B265908|nr:calcium-binding protein [Thalassovita sp.]